MPHMTLEAREAIVQKALSRRTQTLEQIAETNNIGYSTLQKWLRLKREGKPLVLTKQHTSLQQSSPLKHLLATAKLDEQAIGSYCREQGIYSFQLKQWQDELMTGNDSKKKAAQNRSEVKALRAEIQHLKRDLRRKDKALAETSALLILKKKADLIWGDLADD